MYKDTDYFCNFRKYFISLFELVGFRRAPISNKYPSTMKRYCQTLDLKDDPKAIEAYCYWHQHIWPEIPAGIRAVGISNMEIYRLGTRLCMILEVPDDFDWEQSFARLATLDRQAEWEAFVGKYQLAAPGSTSSEKWQLMEPIFKLNE